MTLIDRVHFLLNDANVFWTDAQVYDTVNEVQLEVMRELKWKRQTFVLAMNTGDDLISIPPTCLIPQFFEHNNRRWFPSAQIALERYLRQWKTEPVDVPRDFIVWDMEHFRVYPRPDQPYDFTLWGVVYPTEVSASNPDVEGDDENLREGLAYQTAAELLNLTRPDIAEVYMQAGQVKLHEVAVRLRNQQGHNIRVIKPGTLFTRAQGGDIRAAYGFDTGT